MGTTHVTAIGLLLASTATAQTVYIVDQNQGPGTSFTSLQDAVDIATALDRIEVRPGSYQATTVDHPVRVMGEPGVSVAGISVVGLQGPEPTLFADVRSGFVLTDCGSTVVIDCGGFELFSYDHIDATRCHDLRILGRGPRSLPVDEEISAHDSTVFIDRVDLRPNLAGRVAVMASGTSDVTISNSMIEGARGLASSSPIACSFSIPGAAGVRATDSAVVRLIDTTVRGGESDWSFFCFAPSGPQFEVLDNAAVETSSAPRISLSGSSSVGSTVTIEVDGVAGSPARFLLGRRPTLTPLPGSELPVAHSAEIDVDLGAPAGAFHREFSVPALPRGTLMHCQGLRATPSGGFEASNPTLLVVR